MSDHKLSLEERLAQRGVNRRSFLKFCALMGATLALPASETPRIVHALATATARQPLVWLEFQDCTGDSESFLRASNPNVAAILLETLSVNYQETLMVPSGALATKGLTDTIAPTAPPYLVVVEGSIPAAYNGFACAIGGRAAIDIAREVCGHAAATISVGSCAANGGLPAAAPNPTGAMSVKQAVPGLTSHLSLPGCPMNVANLTAAIVYYLTYGRLPDRDVLDRPLFAYGSVIHATCERRQHYDLGEFVQAWGDEHHRAGWCLFNMGCRGPQTANNCQSVRWNDGTRWDVGAGHPCIGCSGNHFWDLNAPFYVPLPR